jgi:hypothetical protein
MQIVDSVPVCRAIVTHAPLALRGILAIGVGSWITCGELYNEFCTAECRTCGDFGAFLYILGTCERVCFLCFSEEPRYLPLSRIEAARKFGLDQNVVKALPRMKAIPGTYATGGKKVREGRYLVDMENARSAGIALHGSIPAMEQFVSQMAVKKLEEFGRRAKTGARSRRPRTEDPFDRKAGNPLRFMAVVRLPWLDKTSQRLEWGFHCIGCEKQYRCRPLHWRRKFAEASFSEHLRQCGDIQWDSSRELGIHIKQHLAY